MAASLATKLTADTSGFTAAFGNAATVSEREMKRIQGASKLLSDYLKQQQSAMKATGDEARKAADGMEHFGFQSAGAKRELIVLAHELSQGNYTKFGGSMMVIAERTNAMELAFSSAGLAALGVAAGVGIFAAAIIHGAAETEKFNNSLIATGNYAGMTAGKFTTAAQELAKFSGGTIGSSKDVIQQLMSTGTIAAGLISDAARATVGMEKITGQSSEEIVKDFAKMGAGVAKWADDHNKSMHFLSAAQYEYIRTLEEAGKSEEAQKAVFAALNDRLDESRKSVGLFASAWRDVKNSVSSAFDWMAGIGREKTLDEQLQSAQEKLKSLQGDHHADVFNPKMSDQNYVNRQIADYQALIAKLQDTKKVSEDMAMATAKAAKVQQEGIASGDVVRKIAQEYDARSKVLKQIDEYTLAVSKMRAAGDPTAPSSAEENKVVAAMRAKLDPDAKKLDTTIQSLSKSLDDERIKIESSTAYWQKYGKQMDDSKAAVVRFRTEQGDLKAATAAQKLSVINKAEQVDADQRIKNIAEETAKIRDRLAATSGESAAREQSQRELYIAQKTHAILGDTLDKESAAYKVLQASAKSASAALYEAEKVAPALQTNDRNMQQYLEGLQQQVALIGKTNLEKQQQAELLKLEGQLRKDIAAYPEDASKFQDQFQRNTALVKSGLADTYAAQRTWEAGVAESLTRYQEDAGNAAAAASQLWTTGMKGAEDALVSLTTTGKFDVSSLVTTMIQEFMRLKVIKPLLADVFGSSSSGAGLLSGLGAMFGGGGGSAAAAGTTVGVDTVALDGMAADGGQIAAGQTFLVGERGAELFRPNTAGSIIPNSALANGGGGNVTVHLNLTQQVGEFVTPSMAARLAEQTRQAAIAGVRAAQRRGAM